MSREERQRNREPAAPSPCEFRLGVVGQRGGRNQVGRAERVGKSQPGALLFESTIEYRKLRAFAARELEDRVGYRRPTGVDRRRQLVGHVERQSKQRVERGGRRDNDALGGGGFILRGVERELGLQDFEPWHVAVLEACLRRI